ncbi:hypothetical protein T484DRAFT_2241162 [Baffinella frigidus]|nr:hypothetical protein T484DRAFT_2241162 [Cryptophyta sp. CCMP2293]
MTEMHQRREFGKLSLVKKDGTLSSRFALLEKRYLFGRAHCCDIRINLMVVSLQHAELVVDEKHQVWVCSLSCAETTVDGTMVREKTLLTDGAKIGIGSRFFIYHSNAPGFGEEDGDGGAAGGGAATDAVGGWWWEGRAAGSGGGEGAGGSKKKAKTSLPPGVDKEGAQLLHDIQNLSTLKANVIANNRSVLCQMCDNKAAKNHCASCTERQGGVPFGLCGVGAGRSCIGRHFQEYRM